MLGPSIISMKPASTSCAAPGHTHMQKKVFSYSQHTELIYFHWNPLGQEDLDVFQLIKNLGQGRAAISFMFPDTIHLFLKTKAKMNSTVFIIMYLVSSSKCFTSAFSPITLHYLNIFLSAFQSHDFSPWLLFVLQPKTDVLASSFHMMFSNQQYFCTS